MIKSNYHIHSDFCDGHNTLEEMAESAYNAGLKSIGFTSHFVTDYGEECAIDIDDLEEYKERVERLKEKYRDKMDIYYSFEFDYYMDKDDVIDLTKEYIEDVDYVLLSVHTMGMTSEGEMGIIDNTKEEFEFALYDIYKTPENFVKEYYKTIGNMATRYKPDIIGHIDLIKKNNENYFDENASYYKEAVVEALDKIKESGSIVEINTGGVYRYGEDCLYPSEFILDEIIKRDIPITVNGDSHFSDGIDFYYDKIEALLKRKGIESIKVYNGKSWEDYAI